MDEIDKVLLRLLQNDARIGTEQLASEVGLSVTAAKRRVNRLRQDKTITREIAMLDPERVGFSVFTLVFVTLERDRRDIVHNFKQAIRKAPQILQGFYTTGEADFTLLVASRSMAEYEAFTQEFFWENPNIKGFKTMVVMDNVKLGFALPV